MEERIAARQVRLLPEPVRKKNDKQGRQSELQVPGGSATSGRRRSARVIGRPSGAVIREPPSGAINDLQMNRSLTRI